MQRVILTLMLGFAIGCPGTLENPDCFPAENAPRCSIPNFEVQAYFVEHCGTSSCHGATHVDQPGENELDIESPDLFERLSGQLAAAPQCREARMPVIDRQNWQNSYLMKKLRGQHECGERMPQEGLIPEPARQCIGRWLVLGGRLDTDTSVGCVERFDGGEPMDSSTPDGGPAEDSAVDGSPVAMDSGTDAGMDAGTDAGTDAGPDAGPDPVDCSPLADGGFRLCQSRADGCEVISSAASDCNATCALVGFVCADSFHDDAGQCAPIDGGASTACDQAARAGDYCICEAE